MESSVKLVRSSTSTKLAAWVAAGSKAAPFKVKPERENLSREELIDLMDGRETDEQGTYVGDIPSVPFMPNVRVSDGRVLVRRGERPRVGRSTRYSDTDKLGRKQRKAKRQLAAGEAKLGRMILLATDPRPALELPKERQELPHGPIWNAHLRCETCDQWACTCAQPDRTAWYIPDAGKPADKVPFDRITGEIILR